MTRTSHTPEPRNLTPAEMLFLFVKDRLLTLIGLLIIGTGAYIFFGAPGIEATVPRWLQLTGLTQAAIVPIGYLTGGQLRSMFPDPVGIILVDVDAREFDGAVWWLTRDTFNDELTVIEGELSHVAPMLYFGKQLDAEALTVEGNWRGTLDDRELLIGLHKVRECRNQLERDARKGFALRTQMFGVVRKAVRNTTKEVVETFEHGTLPDEGESLQGAVEDAVEDYGLEDQYREQLGDIDTLDADDLEDPTGQADADLDGGDEDG